jgi:hypothetical protein
VARHWRPSQPEEGGENSLKRHEAAVCCQRLVENELAFSIASTWTGGGTNQKRTYL